MVELDVQWGDGADLENLGVERRADRVISSAKCAQKKITPGPLPRTLVRGVACSESRQPDVPNPLFDAY